MFAKKLGSEDESKSPKATKTPPKEMPEQKTSGCCMGTTSCSTPAQSTSFKPGTYSMTSSSEGKKGPKTRITIKYDVGFNNSLYLRGKGANLSWDKGINLKNVKPDEWVWETDAQFNNCEFKVLINDKQYEAGNNHQIACGAQIQYSPHF